MVLLVVSPIRFFVFALCYILSFMNFGLERKRINLPVDLSLILIMYLNGKFVVGTLIRFAHLTLSDARITDGPTNRRTDGQCVSQSISTTKNV